MRSAASDFPVLSFSNPANARPAILLNGSEVFEAVKISRNIFSFFFGSLLTDGVGLVDVIDASDFQVMRTVVAGNQAGQQYQCQDNQLHRSNIYYIVTVTPPDK